MSKPKKIVFITGGVVSSLGKGIIAASLARLLKDQGVKINIMKCDPYLNIDPGTMSPSEHGEVFVTKDGGETDLDLGHYERFLNQDLTKYSSLTSGKIYQKIINKERAGKYLGKTVQVIPHVTNQIRKEIYKNTVGFDLLIVEIGGTIGDLESLAFIETIRQIKFELKSDCLVIHAGYIPYLHSSKELKTKPMQGSVAQLRSYGVWADILISRSEIKLGHKEIDKIAMFCNISKDLIFQSIDLDSVYKIPLYLKKQKLDKAVIDLMSLETKHSNHEELETFVHNLNNLERVVRIAIVGKYVDVEDAYISVVEALIASGIEQKIKVDYELINARKEYDLDYLKSFDGILVPGGFGKNGVEGKMRAIKIARENNIPFLGICFGMQLSVLEFARNICNLDVYHGELNPEENNRIIHLLDAQDINNIGGTLRLGNFESTIKLNTLAYKIYQKENISERHRHRYEFNNEYKNILERHGLVFSGIYFENDLVEIIEYPQNDFFVASQYHPELSSKMTKPHPLFNGFIKASSATLKD